MSWHKITLPLITHMIDPNVVQIGDISKAIWQRENRPAGFAMFHATRGSEGELDDKLLIYLTPVAAELCASDIAAAGFTVEPCGVPARDEPNAAFVFGDPVTMSELKEYFEPEPGTIEWDRAEALRKEFEEGQALYEAQVAEIAREEAAQAEAARAAAAQGEAAQTSD
jgi:hypothetical protein